VPTVEYGDATYLWASNIFQDFAVDGCHPLPGRVEAEDYESMAGVKKEITNDDGGGFNIGGLDDGDWLEYKVAAPTSGQCTVRLRVARPNYSFAGLGEIGSGENTLAVFSVPSTEGWQRWKTVETTIQLRAGEQILRVSASTGRWNINWLEFRRQADIQWHNLPGRIEAEDFDDMYGIRTVMVLNEEPGFNLDCLDAGDWMQYLIDVEKAGRYRISLRIALAEGFWGSAGKLSVGGDVVWRFTVPTTGGWQIWKTITGAADLSSGRQTLRVEVTEGPWNLNWLEFNTR
jgi:endoglucanase